MKANFKRKNFFKLQIFFPLLGVLQVFIKIFDNKTRSSKIIQKYLVFGIKFGFRDLFMIEKNTSCYPRAMGN